MQRKRLKNSTKPLLAHSTRACQYIKYIRCVPYEALRTPGGTPISRSHKLPYFHCSKYNFFGFIFSDFCLSSFSHHL